MAILPLYVYVVSGKVIECVGWQSLKYGNPA
jgi:hypothetical protein